MKKFITTSILAISFTLTNVATANDGGLFNHSFGAEQDNEHAVDCTVGGAPLKTAGLTIAWITFQPWGSPNHLPTGSAEFGFNNTGEFIKNVISPTCGTGMSNKNSK